MDLNSCGLPLLEGLDHANPASIRTLAESVDATFQDWNEAIHQYRWPDVVCFRPSMDYTFVPTSYDNSFDFNTMQYCSWGSTSSDARNFRSGIWMFGCTTTLVSFTGSITAIRASLEFADFKTTSLLTPSVTRYSSDGYRCSRGEENFNLSGLVELFNPRTTPFTPYIRLWGTGSADMSYMRSYFWAARVRGSS